MICCLIHSSLVYVNMTTSFVWHVPDAYVAPYKSLTTKFCKSLEFHFHSSARLPICLAAACSLIIWVHPVEMILMSGKKTTIQIISSLDAMNQYQKCWASYCSIQSTRIHMRQQIELRPFAGIWCIIVILFYILQSHIISNSKELCPLWCWEDNSGTQCVKIGPHVPGSLG